jgi:hypothetical protein
VNTDGIIRLVAAVAAIALVAGPAIAAVAAKVQAGWKENPLEGAGEKAATVTAKDLHIVLDLATRLKAAQCMEGVSLCQQLLDVLLGNTAKAKK